MHRPFLVILARQGNDLADHVGIVRRPVQEHGHDQHGRNDEYDRSDNAFLQCSVHQIVAKTDAPSDAAYSVAESGVLSHKKMRNLRMLQVAQIRQQACWPGDSFSCSHWRAGATA